MSRLNENGNSPASPHHSWEYDGQGAVLPYSEGGLTKREHFASMALQGMLSSPSTDGLTMNDLSKCAVSYADLLLAELDK